MSKLQAELSREKDAKVALEEKLQNKSYSLQDKHSRTKLLLLTEVLSMQLFYALECPALRSSDEITEELPKQAIVETQEEILENVDNLVEVLGTYLNLTEREFCEARNEEYYCDEDLDFENCEFEGSRVGGLETLVVKIRQRLNLVKDSVDGKTLRFLNSVIEKKGNWLANSTSKLVDLSQWVRPLIFRCLLKEQLFNFAIRNLRNGIQGFESVIRRLDWPTQGVESGLGNLEA